MASFLFFQYFRTRPYACDPSKLPKYPPTKEMDAKSREDAQRYLHTGCDSDIYETVGDHF